MITCMHTAQVHVATFSALLPDARHVVRADFLDRARASGIDAVRGEVAEMLEGLARDGAVLCTCSTLGPLIDEAANARLVRIDRPAMEAAAATGEKVTIAICLESTREATVELYQSVAGERSCFDLVLCDEAWPFFEAADMSGFAKAIDAALIGKGERVLLAQASMACAAPLLEARGCEAFTTPQMAADAVFAVEAAVKDS